MKEEELTVGQLMHGNTVYKADTPLFDVYEKDCVNVTNPYCVSFFYDSLKKLSAAVFAQELENIVIDFNGATLRLNGMLQPINLYRCNNVTLKNVNIEYDRGLYSEASVIEVTEKYARVRFLEKFPCRTENGRLIPYGKYWEDDHLFERQMFFQFFDEKTGDGIGCSLGIVGENIPDGQDLCFNPVHYVALQDKDDVIFKPFDDKEKMCDAWQTGARLIIEHGGRNYPAVILHSCKNVRLENVRLINTNSMGILPLHCENVYISGLKLFRDEKSHGILTCSADAVHAIATAGEFVIEDSVMENMMDDALNVHGIFQLITACNGNRLTVKIGSHEITQYSVPVAAGDIISINVNNTMQRRSVHRVVECKIVDSSTAQLVLDSEPHDVCAGDIVENLSCNCSLTIRRCRFGKSNTHLRFQTRGKILIEDCVTELPFWFTGDTTFWYESSPCINVTVRNTYFVLPKADLRACPEICFCDAEPYYHKSFVIKDCVFAGENPIDFYRVESICFTANRHIYNKKMKLRTKQCGTVYAPECETIG